MAVRHRWLLTLCLALGGCAHRGVVDPEPAPIAQAPNAAASIRIDFDDTAAMAIIDWASAGALGQPPELTKLPAYELTQLWATWSGLADPLPTTEDDLRSLSTHGFDSEPGAQVAAAQLMLGELVKRRESLQETLQRVLPAYLPAGAEVQATLLSALMIPPYAFAWGDGRIVVNLSAPFWQGDPERVMNLLVHETWHLGLRAYGSGISAEKAASGRELVDHLAWRTQNEGMATWVAYQARTPGTPIEDYTMLDQPESVARALADLESLLRACATDTDLKRLRADIWQKGTRERALYVAGAHMARIVESRLGRERLVATIVDGPRSFFESYELAKGERASELLSALGPP